MLPSIGTLSPPSFTLLTAFMHLLPHTYAQACAAGSAKEILGNWYCSEVQAITYSNFPGHGYYNRVTHMDAETGECTSQTYHYSGSMSPLNEELSLHIRGPTWLKQVAVYTLDDALLGKKKRDVEAPRLHQRVHSLHQNLHNGNKRAKRNQEDEAEKRALGDVVKVTMDGRLVSWTNDYAGNAAPTSGALPNGGDGKYGNVDAEPTTSSKLANGDLGSSYPTATTSSFSPAGTGPGTDSGSWNRQAYYNADEGTSEGLMFLNHFGGTNGIPGTAAGGPAFGASLSYASPDGKYGVPSSRILKNAMIDDDVEIIILSNENCEDGGCGYTRPGGVAYHGFGGSHKVFLLEFSMPLTGKSGFNGDMPAIWLHNAQIPLTSQYGTNPECSCWTSGCGEFDLFEVLDNGDMRCKSTLHMAPAGGSSDWFLRPTNETITAAVVFAGTSEVAVIRVLDGEQGFDQALAIAVVDGWIKETGGMSMFKLFYYGGAEIGSLPKLWDRLLNGLRTSLMITSLLHCR
ncbi:MAG: hypothetical protein Q9163_001710 [Psora crenata]